MTINLSLLSAVPISFGTEAKGNVYGKAVVLKKRLFGKPTQIGDMGQTVIYVTGFKSVAPSEVREIEQKGNRFIPQIVPIVAGQSIRFPNQDPIYHNVFSISPLATFDLGQYKATEATKTVTFTQYGVVPVYCNIHPKMIAYVVVLENNAFDLTKSDGTFQIEDIPPGQYTLNAWRPKSKRVSQAFTITTGQKIEMQLELVEVVTIKPHQRKDGSHYPVITGKKY